MMASNSSHFSLPHTLTIFQAGLAYMSNHQLQVRKKAIKAMKAVSKPTLEIYSSRKGIAVLLPSGS